MTYYLMNYTSNASKTNQLSMKKNLILIRVIYVNKDRYTDILAVI